MWASVVRISSLQPKKQNIMWIVAIAWIYVVVLMAATEPTVVGGIMTFVFYCAVPLSILFYLTGAKRRRQRSRTAAQGPRKPGENGGTEDAAAPSDADGDGD
ncbi:hypothetical protein [Massilia timonae]|uniref:hypothetical protein n=1 Tax=Massilia timonae TaxID=47229 RepID=UPI0017B31725|nr:hypothetical protein [Massilia timonae]